MVSLRKATYNPIKYSVSIWSTKCSIRRLDSDVDVVVEHLCDENMIQIKIGGIPIFNINLDTDRIETSPSSSITFVTTTPVYKDGKFFVWTSLVHKDEGTIDISYSIDRESSIFDIKIDNAVNLEFSLQS